MTETPVAMIVFNRPEVTAQVLQRVAAVRPRRLYVIGDGARSGVSGDDARVHAVSKIFDHVPWSCQVVRQFSQDNMGCHARVTSGLDWLFSEVPSAIILEDDCLPMQSFFPFCEDLLTRYQHDERVASVCGTTHDLPDAFGPASYRFSRYCFIWGWATWRRAWAKHESSPTPLDDEALTTLVNRVFSNWRARLYWKMIFRRCQEGQINTWDYQWLLSCWKHNMVHAVPRTSMVDNIGFGSGATHTIASPYDVSLATDITFPLVHPGVVTANAHLDDSIEDRIFSRNLYQRAAWLFNRVVGLFRQ